MANRNHLLAIDRIGFVHERTPTGSPQAGSWFVHRSEFNADHPTVRVVSDDDSTELHVFDGYEFVYSVRFDPATPGNVVNQAVAAALQAAGL